MTFTHAIGTNNYGCAKFIVSASAANGTHTTIASALAVATSGDTIFIRAGSYTENLTLIAGVSLSAFSGDSDTPNVTIIGTLSFASAGTVTISNIRLQTNASTNILSITGSAASIINLNYCYLNCSSNTGISFTTANTSALITCYRCNGNLGTTGISYHSSSSTGQIFYWYCNLSNTGGSSTVTTNSAGAASYFYTNLTSPVSTTSTANLSMIHSIISTVAQNVTSITTAGNGANNVIAYSYILSGSASAISIGVGTTCNANNNTISSSNTAAITGAGAITVAGNSFLVGSSYLINTTTQTGGTIQGGLIQAPSVGFIGERITANGNPSLTSATPANITSISLTAGIWDITVIGNIVATTGTIATVGIGTTTATFGGTQGDQFANFIGAFSQVTISIPAFRAVLAATTTYYGVVQATFVSGGSAFGRISATRVG